MKNNLKIVASPFVFIIALALIRLFPHVPNFAPIGAMALFGGVYLGKKYSIIMVMITLLISDYLLLYVNPFAPQMINFSRFYSPTALIHATTLYVYGSFLLTILIGMWLKKHKSMRNIILSSVVSSLLFFLITNFGVWAAGAYARSLNGLWESYLMGLPFLRSTVFGDLFYSGVFFSSYEVVRNVVSGKKLLQGK